MHKIGSNSKPQIIGQFKIAEFLAYQAIRRFFGFYILKPGENGKVKHLILFTLGALTDEQAARMRLAIRAYSDSEILGSKLDDLVVTKHLAYLDIISLHHLWRSWSLDEFFKTDRWVKAMVFNRCIDPVAKINIRDWLGKTVLPALLDFGPNTFSSYDVYRELDRLTERESELQSFLYRQLQS